jgi:hypothetical protein
MSLEKHYRVIMLLGGGTIALAVVGTVLGDSGAPLLGVIAAAVMAVASWAKKGWDDRPKP